MIQIVCRHFQLFQQTFHLTTTKRRSVVGDGWAVDGGCGWVGEVLTNSKCGDNTVGIAWIVTAFKNCNPFNLYTQVTKHSQLTFQPPMNGTEGDGQKERERKSIHTERRRFNSSAVICAGTSTCVNVFYIY